MSTLYLIFGIIAFQNADSIFVATILLSNVIFAWAADTLFKDINEFSMLKIIGTIVIVFFITISIYSELRQENTIE